MDETLAQQVRVRAGHRCEYCRLPESLYAGPFEIEHVIAKQHGGPTSPGSLANACLRCNKKKGPNLSGIDRQTSRTRLVRVFNPRLGVLENRVTTCDQAPPWRLGISDLMRNLALDREKDRETILRLNGLLNDLMAREVGVNDGKFLPEVVRPKKPPLTFEDR